MRKKQPDGFSEIKHRPTEVSEGWFEVGSTDFSDSQIHPYYALTQIPS